MRSNVSSSLVHSPTGYTGIGGVDGGGDVAAAAAVAAACVELGSERRRRWRRTNCITKEGRGEGRHGKVFNLKIQADLSDQVSTKSKV